MAESLREICERLVARAKPCDWCKGGTLAVISREWCKCMNSGWLCDAGFAINALKAALEALRALDVVDEPEETCGKPCPPDHACDACAEYWQRMRGEGYWKDGHGWTAKGLREMMI